MMFLYILFAAFSYFLFLWSFRIIFLILIGKVIGQLKTKAEAEVKSKIESLKRG